MFFPFFVSSLCRFSLSLFLSLYSIDLRIYFSVADLDRMSRMFSLVLSPKFYRGRTSIVISLFGIHFPIFPSASRSVTHHLPPSRSLSLSSSFSLPFCLSRSLCLTPFALLPLHAVLSLVLPLVSFGFDAFSCSFV